MTRLELRGVSKTYRGGIAAAKGVDLTVESGEMFVIVGPSGSGKSTLLRLIAGLESVDAGSIHLGGRRIDQRPPYDRDLAMVFQDAVVYPHLDVFENIAFGLRARRVARDEIQSRVAATAEMVGLADALKRSPTTLSGGQKRRVTLARALVVRPSLFLLDEPFSGLDGPLKTSIRDEIADLHRQLAATMVLVTHDQGDALALADRIAVVDQGRVIQVGRPLDVYDAPRNPLVARFFGQPPMSVIPCIVAIEELDSIRVSPTGTTDPSWSIARQSRSGEVLGGRSGRIDLGFRSENTAIGSAPGSAIAEVVRLEPSGHETGATLRLGSHRVLSRLPARTSVQVGDHVLLAIDFDRASWFDPETGDRIGRD